jgi:hypothetical protein
MLILIIWNVIFYTEFNDIKIKDKLIFILGRLFNLEQKNKA